MSSVMFDHKHRLEFEDDDKHEDEHECGQG